jgi:sialate O-acetylesterase
LLVRACCVASLSFACSSSPPADQNTLPSAGQPGASGSNSVAGGSASASGAGGTLDVGGAAQNLAGSAVGGASASGGTSAGAAGSPSGGGTAVGFEGGAVAAVSLTYDDGLDPHLAIVQPALEAAGFRGTFFLSNFEGVDNDWALPSVKLPLTPLTARHQAWQAAAQKGHELADHTVNHPCNDAAKAPNYHLTDYTQERMSAELDESIARLARLGVAPPLTFAYPCASDKAGIGPNGDDYSPLVGARFYAARVSVDGIADAATVELLHVPQLDTGGKTGDQLKKMVDDAIAAKGWLVLLFHGVGTPQASCPGNLAYAPDKCMINYLTTSTEAHAALVQYLVEKKAQVWTAPFGKVATLIKNSRK